MREPITIEGVQYDNLSPDGKVGFIEEGHIYRYFPDPDFKFTSVTTIIKDYEEEFDEFLQSERCSKNKRKPQYYGRPPEDIRKEWSDKANAASSMGTLLHDYGEKLLNGEDVPAEHIPDSPMAKYVPELVKDLWGQGYELDMTELLVYNTYLGYCGQSDIVLKKKLSDGKYKKMIYDFKFLSKPIQKKSFFNPRTRKYKYMSGPFKWLMDCNWLHYSIQLSIYQTLAGQPQDTFTEKVLVVVTKDGYEFVPCLPMRVFWDDKKQLQCVHMTYKGEWYDSRTNRFYKDMPSIPDGI